MSARDTKDRETAKAYCEYVIAEAAHIKAILNFDNSVKDYAKKDYMLGMTETMEASVKEIANFIKHLPDHY